MQEIHSENRHLFVLLSGPLQSDPLLLRHIPSLRQGRLDRVHDRLRNVRASESCHLWEDTCQPATDLRQRGIVPSILAEQTSVPLSQ